MRSEVKPLLKVVLLAAAAMAGSAFAQQTIDQVTCRAGTMTVLAQSEGMIVWSLDHRGVTRTNDPNDPFNMATERCVGVVSNVGGKLSANGWCKTVDPKDGDWTLVDWTGSDKPGTGTFTFRYGSGRWKGVTGNGTYESLGQNRAVDGGTYQNCVRVKGTRTVPG